MKKLKNGILLIALTIIAMCIISSFNNVKAAIVTDKTLDIRTMGYEVNEKVVYKIYDTNNDNKTFYCIKGGPGFGSSTMMVSGANSATSYTNGTGINDTIGDLRYKNLIDSNYANVLPQNSNNYKALLWILDQCYVPAKNASDQDRADSNKVILLEAVEEYVANWTRVHGENARYENTSLIETKLTDNIEENDIILVQQLAIWHYTNSDEYHFNQMPAFKLDASFGGPLNNDEEDTARINACNALFDYLVQTPKQSGFSYDYTENGDTTEPAQFVSASKTAKVKVLGDRKIIGPYRIKGLRADVNYTLDYTLTDGNNNEISKSNVKFVNSNGTKIADTIKELVDIGDFYISIPSQTNTNDVGFAINGSFMVTTLTYWGETNVQNLQNGSAQPVVQIEKEDIIFDDYKSITTKPTPGPDPDPEAKFDLALRKFITSIRSADGTNVRTPEKRVPTISSTTLGKLANKSIKTAEKVHNKNNPQPVKTGDIVTYTIRVYNEGEIDGWATEVTDYLPEGLEFVPKAQSTINTTYGWSVSADGRIITTNYLADSSRKLNAFNGTTLDYEDLLVECKVVATVESENQNLKNIAEITGNKDINGNTNLDLDRDSVTGNVNHNNYNPKDPEKGMGEQDDDDYEDLILYGESFDLSLRKFITNVTNPNTTKPTIMVSREPNVITTPLLNGKTTATYNHTKEPVGVSIGSIVTYTIRVYNEGHIDGYVTEITDHLPPQLEFIIDDELNQKYGWQYVEGSNGRKVKTDITSPNTKYSANRDSIYADRNTVIDLNGTTDKVLLKAFTYKKGEKLDYIDVQIRCRVKEDIDLYEKITNIAEITKFTDSEGQTIVDRDSTADSLTKDNSKTQDKIQNDNLPTDANLPTYKDEEIDSKVQYIPGQQDDDDFEKLVLQRFDLALRKFITEVKNEDGSNVRPITNRAPIFKIVDGKYTYEHTKEPVDVANSNIVTYTLRIFNEGNMAGYATKVKDDIPDGLEFLPEDSTNTAFGWKMYKENENATGEDDKYIETKDPKEAVFIATDFLSKDKEKTEGNNLLKAFDTKTMTQPDYKDLKVAFKVTEPNTSDRIIINKAQISEDSDENGDPVDDVDSEPDKWNDGEDDQDIEKVKVKYFDLSLRKWVTESIVTVNGKTTVTKSGHKAEDDPEAPMKVEIQTANINKTTVKFRFNIRVKNEGEIAGYATELIDYIPEGLKFVAKDNPKWKEVDGKVTTDQLKDKLLQPGESAVVDIVLTWINGKDNMGEKVNWAEISKDKNEFNSPDIDSTPGNNVKGEDDIDQAPVLLSPATGSAQTYIALTLGCVAILAGGVLLIKKFVI